MTKYKAKEITLVIVLPVPQSPLSMIRCLTGIPENAGTIDRRENVSTLCYKFALRGGQGGEGKFLLRRRETDIQNSTLEPCYPRGGKFLRKGVTNKQNSNQQAVSHPWAEAPAGENTDEKGADEKLSHEVPEMNGQRLA
ncbi:hypothetical protein TNCV_3928281 [Trichonephila clavipes]|nr:hypothetical protein TNCV_3928281 [Trichonephila clavipes]